MLNKSPFSRFWFLPLFLFLSLPAFAEPAVTTYDQLIHAIRDVRHQSQARIEAAVKQEKVREAWETGKLIHEHILLNKDRAEYGAQVIERLSKDLGVSRTELGYMVEFAKAYISQPAGKLSWSHYTALLSINDEKERNRLEKEAEEGRWDRERLREEIRKHKSYIEAETEPLTAVKPSGARAWRIILAVDGPYKGKLALDLGFANFYRPENFKGFKPGDIVTLKGKKLKPASESGPDLFTYPVYIRHIVDGDTFYAMIDLGFGFMTVQKLRLRGLDAPEIESSEGKEAKEFLEDKLTGASVIIRTSKPDKYDRYLADVWVKDKFINQELLDKKLAVRVNE